MNEYFTAVQIKIIRLEYHQCDHFFLVCCSRMKSYLHYKERNIFHSRKNVYKREKENEYNSLSEEVEALDG